MVSLISLLCKSNEYANYVHECKATNLKNNKSEITLYGYSHTHTHIHTSQVTLNIRLLGRQSIPCLNKSFMVLPSYFATYVQRVYFHFQYIIPNIFLAVLTLINEHFIQIGS